MNIAPVNQLAREWGQAITARRETVAEITGKPFTQRMLADAIGVSQAAVSGWERGEKLPSHFHIPKIAKALSTKPEALFKYPQVAA